MHLCIRCFFEFLFELALYSKMYQILTKEVSCFQTALSVANDCIQEQPQTKPKIPTSNCVSLDVRSAGLEYAVLNIATLIMNALLSPEFYAVSIPEALAIYVR